MNYDTWSQKMKYYLLDQSSLSKIRTQVHSREEKLNKKTSTKKAERQENLKKARVWHLNRKREKDNRKSWVQIKLPDEDSTFQDEQYRNGEY